MARSDWNWSRTSAGVWNCISSRVRWTLRRVERQAGEPDDDVSRVVCVHLEQVAVIHDRVQHIEHVVRLIGIFRNDAVQDGTVLVGRFIGNRRCFFLAILRNVTQQALDLVDALETVCRREVGYARFGGMRNGTTQLFGCDLLVGDGLDHVGARDEHVRDRKSTRLNSSHRT